MEGSRLAPLNPSIIEIYTLFLSNIFYENHPILLRALKISFREHQTQRIGKFQGTTFKEF